MSDTLTPMMAQYRKVRSRLPAGTILFFRLGDFYEMFFEDAVDASRILEIALTKRQNVPMCGVPYHAADNYVARLIRAGRKVALCDQMEDATQAKGIVRRELTGIVTPGTVTQEAILSAGMNNYLAGVCRAERRFGLAMLDLSTGEFWGEEMESAAALAESIGRHGPREVVVPQGQRDDAELQPALAGLAALVTPTEDWTFLPETARERLIRHFRVHSLEGFGCEDRRALVAAAGAVLHYVQEDLQRPTAHVRALRARHPGDFMMLDEAAREHLALAPRHSGERPSKTLLEVLDSTCTAMGARLLREWLLRPLTGEEAIRERHDAVELLTRERSWLADLRAALKEVRDLERLIARVASSGGNGRDLRAVAQSLGRVPEIRNILKSAGAKRLQELAERLTPMPEVVAAVETAIVDDPPAGVREGGLIRKGYDAALDELRAAATEGRAWLAQYQQQEQGRTGLKTLKVRYNKVFGYYIELSKGQAGLAPPEYVRKQTLTNAERFTTPELKEYERRVVGAQERAAAMEYEFFLKVREQVVAETARIQQVAGAMAEADVLACLAERALANGYTRPRVHSGGRIWIREGRHPVIEQMPDAERFVPNDTLLDNEENQLLILTGPNMAGKSTYIRQVALIVIMAQMGSFVPAAEAEIGLVDRVFTRVGAGDDIARGRSTFMVEMQEVANILHHATRRSLIVLDEIGRGTSTFDGISIAWAVAEHLHNHDEVKAKTLFATHYHELTDLALTMPGVKNYNVLVSERGDQVVFLRRIVPGAADKSYGIQVARLAGLPQSVIERAKEILSNLEEGEFSEGGLPKIARSRRRRERNEENQLSLFDVKANGVDHF